LTALIRDRYEPRGIVGHGGQGEVMRALDRLHGTIVALKIRPVRSASERDEILSEARILRGLRPHAGVTLVREDFFDGDRYVMVMDWIEGRSLAATLAEDGPLPIDTAVQLLRQTAAALDHMHVHDPPIVHGDVKPANIVVAPDGHVVLVDFGIAVRGRSTARMATTAFAAPELTRGEPLTPAADIYSLAATAVAVLTGGQLTFGAHLELPLPRQRLRRIERALTRGLDPDPRRRARSAGALIEALSPSGRSNLPAPLTSLVGRRAQLRAAEAMFDRSRLVTLVGPGGVGKTRLAIATASAQLEQRPGGCWFVGLAPLRDATLAGNEIARALGAPAERGLGFVERIARHLGEPRTLIVLDNAEHVLDGVANAATQLLEAIPNLVILATSRQPLGVTGEEILRVPPLSLPGPSARASEAVRLFRDRARAADRAFRLTEETTPAVVEICRRLDGIPLALELAAARIATFSAPELADRLDERYRLLAAPGEPLPHHRTLQATVGWSVDLLTPDERTMLSHLGVFAGTFTLTAAVEVCHGGPIAADDVPALLARLVDRSLVLREGRRAPGRYRILETVRTFACEPAGHALHLAHLRWCAHLVATDGGTTAWVEQVADALDDIRAALGWSVEHAPLDALALSGALAHFWSIKGHLAEGRGWIERTLVAAGDDAAPAQRAAALHASGSLARAAADYPEATRLFDASLEIRRALDDQGGQAKTLNGLGVVAMDQGDNVRARILFEESAEIARALGDPALLDAPVSNLGIIAVAEQDFGTARALHTESLEIARARDDAVGVAYSLQNLGVVEKGCGNVAEALSLLRKSLAILHGLGDVRAMCDCLLLFGEIWLDQERFTDAARAFGASEAARARIGAPLPEYARPDLARAVAAARAGAGDAAFEAAWETGTEAALDDMVALATSDPHGSPRG
jgi:non-specific serine/threonine protein kinase